MNGPGYSDTRSTQPSRSNEAHPFVLHDSWNTNETQRERKREKSFVNYFQDKLNARPADTKRFDAFSGWLIYKVFRNLWDPLRELIVRLKIMGKCHINICPICLRLWDIMNLINRANSSKPVLLGMVYSIFIIIIIGMKKTHVLLCIQNINTSLV